MPRWLNLWLPHRFRRRVTLGYVLVAPTQPAISVCAFVPAVWLSESPPVWPSCATRWCTASADDSTVRWRWRVAGVDTLLLARCIAMQVSPTGFYGSNFLGCFGTTEFLEIHRTGGHEVVHAMPEIPGFEMPVQVCARA